MAKKRSREQIDADRIIKANLLILGEKIYNDSTETSRVAKDTYYKDGSINKIGGTLRDSQNFRVMKDTQLVMAQVYYGQYNYPKGTTSGQKNALLIAVNKYQPEQTKIIVAEINEQLLKNFKK